VEEVVVANGVVAWVEVLLQTTTVALLAATNSGSRPTTTLTIPLTTTRYARTACPAAYPRTTSRHLT